MIKMLMRARWFILILGILGAYIGWALYKPLPDLVGVPQALAKPRAVVAPLVWPARGQAAVGIVGSPILETHGSQTPSPTASTAKLITVLTILDHKPLTPGQPGPTLTMTQNDVNLFTNYANQDGSNVRVSLGEQLTEYQMLEGILLPSANNLADSLAIWAFGSMSGYQAAAKQYLIQHGLSHTAIGSDASGFAPDTTSTAQDLVTIGGLAMQDPVVAGIVSQNTVGNYPLLGSIKNVNWLLGKAGIIGIKTGNSDQAGGVFVSASRITVNGQLVTVVTAITHSTTLQTALDDSLPLIQSAQANFSKQALIAAGTPVGYYHVPWGKDIPAVAAQSLALQIWNKTGWQSTVTLNPIRLNQTSSVGTIQISANGLSKHSVPLRLQSQPPKPSVSWRLRHPL